MAVDKRTYPTWLNGEVKSVQKEYTEPTKLLDDNGNLIAPGWARHNVFQYDRSQVVPKMRSKEWDFYQISDGKYMVQLNFANISFGGFISAKLIDLHNKQHDRKHDTNTVCDATILYLQNKFLGRKFYSMGTESFTSQLRDAGIDVTTELSDDIFGLIISNDTELTFKKLDDACILLGRGVEYIATNPDWVCPTWYGYVPDCGSFAQMLKRATGRVPTFIGKPKPEMLLLAMEKFGYTKDETVMVGDRVYTDIASGYNAGVDTVFVLSGEGTREDAESSDTKPTYILENIRELFERIQ